MKITRGICPFPSKNTFLIKPIQKLLNQYVQKGKWIDPFVNQSYLKKFCYKTNDLNPKIKADHHWDAIEFLKLFEDNSIDGVLCDPPYTLRQAKELYESVGIKMTQYKTQYYYSELRDEISRILKPEGLCISFGYNSTGIGKNRGFTILEILLVNLAGNHHDILVTVDKKEKVKTLDEFL